MYKVVLSSQAVKDLDMLKKAGVIYVKKAHELIGIVEENPYKTPPPFEKLSGKLQGYCSRRINNQHRFVYDILPNTNNDNDENGEPYKGIVHVLRMWTHYE